MSKKVEMYRNKHILVLNYNGKLYIKIYRGEII